MMLSEEPLVTQCNLVLFVWFGFTRLHIYFFLTWRFFCLFSDTPRRWVLLHILVWMFGINGIIFIFLSHGHYSIDVIVAFVITSRLFLYHHFIADNIHLFKISKGLLLKWFPLLYSMESNSQGLVPNEYEWPFPSLKRIKRFLRGKSLSIYDI